MNKITRVGLLLVVLFLAGAVSAHAATITFDFGALANVAGAEHSYTPSYSVTQSGLMLTVTSGNYAYLDAGVGGLGVCQTNTTDCGSDDNIDLAGEVLNFKFNSNVTIASIVFNNNHDGGFTTGTQLVLINGVATSLPGATTTERTLSPNFSLSSGSTYTIGYYTGDNGQQFYVESITVTTPTVPEPATAALMCVGLFGLALAGKRLKPAYRRNR